MDEVRPKKLRIAGELKILSLVADGLGGLPLPQTGSSEMEEANCSNLDDVARRGVCGMKTLSMPVSRSRPGHLTPPICVLPPRRSCPGPSLEGASR